KAFDQLVVQLMSKGPTERQWDAAAVAQSLGKILEKAGRGDGASKRAGSNGQDVVYPERMGVVNKASEEKGTGKKKRKTGSSYRPELAEVRDLRWWLGTGGLVLAALVMVGIFAYALTPPSAKALFEEAKQLVATGVRDDLNRAIEIVDELDRRYPDN